jgi:hypothetical protein
MALAQLDGDDDVKRRADGLSGRVAEHRLRRTVPVLDRARRVRHDHGVVGVVHEAGQHGVAQAPGGCHDGFS